VRLGRDHPFAQAAETLAFFTGVVLSPSTVRRLTETTGMVVRQLELTFSESLWAGEGCLPETPGEQPLQLSLDGSLIHIRDEGWREVKLLTIGERTPTGLAQQSYAATLGNVDQFEAEMLGEIMRRAVSTTADVVSVNDGADWIQRVLDLHCPQAHRVLDFVHAAEYLGQAALVAFADPEQRHTWYRQWRQELLTGDPSRVLEALAALTPTEERDTALGYLTSRQEQIQYATFRARGWPIGSGCVESAHGHLVQARLKGGGMHWRREGAAAVLALRVAMRNGRWDSVWPTVVHQRATHRRQRHPPVAPPPVSPAIAPAPTDAAPARPPKEPTIVNGRPTTHHPWKRLPAVG
jgi:hypothetical protein